MTTLLKTTLISLIFIGGCTATGTADLKKKTLTLKGWGSKEFYWKENGVEAGIKRGEPIACPSTVPIIK